jgi:deuterolysin
MKTFGLFTVAALASYATAAAVDAFKRDTPLKVELSAAGNSLVKVVLTNNGNETLNLLNKGTFLDEDYPLEKVTIYANKGSKYQLFQILR